MVTMEYEIGNTAMAAKVLLGGSLSIAELGNPEMHSKDHELFRDSLTGSAPDDESGFHHDDKRTVQAIGSTHASRALPAKVFSRGNRCTSSAEQGSPLKREASHESR